MGESVSTYYLPDCRKSGADLAREEQQFAGYPLLALLIDLPLFLLVTNECRQIVWANREARKVLGESDVRILVGKRPGEALGCVHSSENPAGCGTTKFCVFCGRPGASPNPSKDQAAPKHARYVGVRPTTSIPWTFWSGPSPSIWTTAASSCSPRRISPLRNTGRRWNTSFSMIS